MTSFARVAYIASARNLDGGVVCRPASTLPFLLAEGQQVYFVPPILRGPRQAHVLSVTEIRPGSWEVFFEGVDSREDAEALVDSYCLVAQDELPVFDVAQSPQTLQGFAVEDAAFGPLGVVVLVQDNSAQVLLEIEGKRGLVLVPYVDEFVARIDEAKRVVYTTVSESLLTLNANGEGRG